MITQETLKFYDRHSFYTDGRIDRDIENNRKGGFVLEVLGKDGKPVENAKVHINQVSHDFGFGCAAFLLDEFETEEENKLFRKYFSDLFNYATLPLYWDTLEPNPGELRFAKDSAPIYRRPSIDLIREYCKENGIRMKGHCLMYHSFNPKWIPSDHRELKMAVDKRLREIGEHCGSDFVDVDVINELHSKYRCLYGEILGIRNYPIADERDHVNWAFSEAKKYFPFSRLHWNEGCYQVFGDSYVGEKSYYYMMLEKYLREGVPIEAIGMQFHTFGSTEQNKYIYNPVRALDLFDLYSELGLPIHMSEVSIPSYSNEEEGEALQAEMVKRLYKLWFSVKNMDAAIWWNLVDDTAYGDECKFKAGLIRRDMTLKPAYKVLYDLIHKEWHTELSGETGSEGTIEFNGFYGNYEVTVESDGKKSTETLRFSKENTGYLHHDKYAYGLRPVRFTVE